MSSLSISNLFILLYLVMQGVTFGGRFGTQINLVPNESDLHPGAQHRFEAYFFAVTFFFSSGAFLFEF